MVSNYIKPLLEGSAFNEMANCAAQDFDGLSRALRSRYGKTADEVTTELLSFKQGNMSVDDYVDKVTEMATQANIPDPTLVMAAKMNLNEAYIGHFQTLLQASKISGK